MKKKIDWHFKQTSPSDYQIGISCDIETRLMKIIFSKAREKLARKHNMKVSGDFEKVSRVPIPKQYYNIVRTALHKVIKNVRDEVKKDGFDIINAYVISGYYYKIDKKKWLFSCMIEGQVADKR